MLNKVIDYIKKVYIEMRKVAWPTRSELTNSTTVVIIISAVVALIVFVLDLIFRGTLGLIIK